MDFGGPGFVLAIIAMSFMAWIITTAIRARHGYPVEGEFGGLHHPAANEETKALADENKALKETVSRLEERLKVLERIATDPSRQLADDIEKLR